ncbi:hypothetical protein [Novipirellula caenicola]|uniref:Uncharacterized protein n=1 Tax=Novipirellula caenicola TaxID=1536901 RepID=A0ABP9VR45_9BACT
MSQSEFLSTSSLTPKKLALIVVLVGVLGFVLFSPAQESTEFEIPSTRRDYRAITNTSFQKSQDNVTAPIRWPDVRLQQVLQTNPFETIFVKKQESVSTEPEVKAVEIPTEPVVEPIAAVEPKTKIEHRPHDAVEIIYQNTSGRIAVIESQLVRVGDVLPQGRVVEITPSHVIIAVEVPVESAASEPASNEPASKEPVTGEPVTGEPSTELPAVSGIPGSLND